MKYLFTLLFLLAFGSGRAQDVSKSIDAYASSYVNTGDFSGCILITKDTKDGETLYENCFGFANRSFDVSNKKDTKFMIGSISKQFTAAAILILEQKGLLHTDDSLSRFFPNHPHAKNITIQQLLTHTSGIPDIFNLPDFNNFSCQRKSIAELSDLLLEAKQDFKAGSQYQYSNGGYALLADIIEKASGQSYGTFLDEHIFRPLKMKASGHCKRNQVVSGLATGYDPLSYDDLRITDFLDPELLKGSGSLYSTVHDLHFWIHSIKNKSLLTAASYDKFLHNYGHNYGYGISLYKSFGQKVFGHDGRINGFIADYLYYSKSDLSIVILGNVQTGVADFFRRDVAAIVFDKAYKSRAKTIPPAKHSITAREKMLGTYEFGPGLRVYVEEIDGRLQARANEGSYSELVLLEDQRFFSRTLYSYISFVSDEKGNITNMVWTNNDGDSFEGKKF